MDGIVARFAPVKINLFLELSGKRPDGYHEISTIMETIAVGDMVRASPAATLVVEADRADVPGGEANTAFRIVRAAERALGRPLPARIELAKGIAPGTGLGAGSSDAAAALDLVLALHGATADVALRRRLAGEVGSDVGFFVTGGLAHCTGRGEIVTPLPQRGVRHVVLVLGGPPCATPEVYRKVVLSGPPVDPGPWLAALARGATLVDGDGPPPFNRLAQAAEAAFPVLGDLRRRLAGVAGRAPCLSGSGGTFFFLCRARDEAEALARKLRVATPDLDVRAVASFRSGAEDGA